MKMSYHVLNPVPIFRTTIPLISYQGTFYSRQTMCSGCEEKPEGLTDSLSVTIDKGQTCCSTDARPCSSRVGPITVDYLWTLGWW